MYQCKVTLISNYRRKTTFIIPKCGHELEFEYTTPYVCKEPRCSEKPPKIDKLFGDNNQDNRVKFYAEGKI